MINVEYVHSASYSAVCCGSMINAEYVYSAVHHGSMINVEYVYSASYSAV